nr:solute carrier family 25 member 47 [Chlorocebus sabaeus]
MGREDGAWSCSRYWKGRAEDGVCGVAVGYPLDTVKVSHLTQGSLSLLCPQSSMAGTIKRVRIQTEPKYTGIWHCIRDTYHRERVWGFYRGLSLPVCTVSLVSSVSFGTYRHCLAHICQLRYGSPDAKPSKADIALSGYASGLVREKSGRLAPGRDVAAKEA